MDAQEFITKKYEHNNWGLYPPSRRLVGEWLEEFAKEYHAEQLRLGAVVGRSEQLVICKKCGSSEMYQYTKTKDKCDDCGNIQDY